MLEHVTKADEIEVGRRRALVEVLPHDLDPETVERVVALAAIRRVESDRSVPAVARQEGEELAFAAPYLDDHAVVDAVPVEQGHGEGFGILTEGDREELRVLVVAVVLDTIGVERAVVDRGAGVARDELHLAERSIPRRFRVGESAGAVDGHAPEVQERWRCGGAAHRTGCDHGAGSPQPRVPPSRRG